MAYRLGKPTKGKPNMLAGLVIVVITAVVLSLVYLLLVKNSVGETTIKNNDKPLVSDINPRGGQERLAVNEPTFSLSLPGPWKETARDTDNRYHSIQWNYTAKKAANRWVRVYVDTIPADQPVNYLLPVTAADGRLELGQLSDNCLSFTQGTDKPAASGGLPARWQGVSFMCDNVNKTYQVVGTGSPGTANGVTVTGSRAGSHRYFFMYRDDSFHPDFTVLSDILSSFKAR